MNPRARFLLRGIAFAVGALLVRETTLAAQAKQTVEFTVSGLTLPFVDPSGRVTHRLTAKTGTKSGDVQQLRGVELQYFSATEPGIVTQTLTADEATWDERRETLAGRGRIVVTTAENKLTGEGFDFAVATSRLHIQRDFSMANSELVLTSDRAVIDLLVEKTGENLKVRDVRRCEAIGNVVITVLPTATKDYRFEQAFSEIGIYDGLERRVTLPKPTRTLYRGAEGTIQTFSFRLKPPPK